MAQFYLSGQGDRGEVTRRGSKNSSITAHARGWALGGRVEMSYNTEKDRDEVTIYITSGSNGGGQSKRLGTFYVSKKGNYIKVR